ncbi:MAG: PIG-L deacetylase family protein [Dehalococcoidia bacterium]
MVAEDQTKRVLVVAAHPDDPDFGAGGTAALWSREGWEFYYLVCTNGAKGSSDAGTDQRALVQSRQEEQRRAAQALGVRDVFFLDNEDGELVASRPFLGHVTWYIRKLRPYAVFTHSTDLIVRNQFINHSDHRATGLTAVDAVYPAARDPLNFPEHLAEGLEPHKVKQVYIWGANQWSFTVDITDVVELKVQALLRHQSQFGAREDFMQRVRERWVDEDGRYSEKFQLVELQF